MQWRRFFGAAERSARLDVTEVRVLHCEVSKTFVFNVAERTARSWTGVASFLGAAKRSA